VEVADPDFAARPILCAENRPPWSWEASCNNKDIQGVRICDRENPSQDPRTLCQKCLESPLC
jgi:hypothetical protein